MKVFYTFFAATTLLFFMKPGKNPESLNSNPAASSAENTAFKPSDFAKPHFGFSGTGINTVLANINTFKALLSASQLSTVQLTFSTTAAKKWSNLPCGSMCRNGIQFSTLNATQLAAAYNIIAAAAGTASNDGYDEFIQILTADSVLNVTGGGSYGKGIYFIAFLNTPSATGAWMLQFGGHHYAANIAFNGGKVVGTTPTFEGVEPKSYTVGSGATATIKAPLKQEVDSMKVMLASLSSTQLALAKLTTTFSDVLLGPGQDGNFPATKQGLAVSTLSTAQQTKVINAMLPWLRDAGDSSGLVLLAIYQAEINSTYIAYASNNSAVAGDSSTFLIANTDYVRIDGPSVWIEFVCQNGVVFSGIHYHTIYRDHSRDYGSYLTNTALPLKLVTFDAASQGEKRLISWTTATETGVDHFELQRSTNASEGFSTLTQAAAQNRSSNSYFFTDNDLVSADVIYYRLKMVDQDGYSRYSYVITVRQAQSTNAVTISPNPTNDRITISLSASVTNATLRITNSLGNLVFKGSNYTGLIMNVDISALSTGTYFIQLEEGKRTIRGKFIKSNKL